MVRLVALYHMILVVYIQSCFADTSIHTHHSLMLKLDLFVLDPVYFGWSIVLFIYITLYIVLQPIFLFLSHLMMD